MTLGYPIDLHTHSLRSDGAYEPTELVERAALRGVRILALADHDTLAGAAEATAALGATDGVSVGSVPLSEQAAGEWLEARRSFLH